MHFTQFALSENFDRAFLFASRLHRFQKRKNIPMPFMVHLMSVASLTCEHIGFVCDDPREAENYVMTAILHDTIEDQGGAKTYDALKDAFGPQIADNVLMLSDSIPDEKGQKPPKSERNLAYYEKMTSAPIGIVLISCCDKVHNMRTMHADFLVAESPATFWKAFSQEPSPTIANYQKLHDLYAQRLGENRIIRLYEEALDAIEKIPQ